MKKIVLILMLLCLCACGNNESVAIQNQQNNIDTSKTGEYTYIDLFEATQKFKNGDEIIVAFTQELCGYCQEFDYYYDLYRQDHYLNIYNVNLTNENRSEQENLEIIIQYWPTFYNTPGIYYCKDGKVVSSLTDHISYMDMEVLSTWVDEYNLLTIENK